MTTRATAWEADLPEAFGGGRALVVTKGAHDAVCAEIRGQVARAEARATAWRRAHDALVEAGRADNDNDVRGGI